MFKVMTSDYSRDRDSENRFSSVKIRVTDPREERMYPEMMIAPMRQELTSAGIAEARTAADVDNAVAQKGTVMVVVNSVCGCAAGKMRPGVRAAIRNAV